MKHLVAVERRRNNWRRTQAAVRSFCGRTEPNTADSEDDELETRSNNSLVNKEDDAGLDVVVVKGFLEHFVDEDVDDFVEMVTRRL